MSDAASVRAGIKALTAFAAPFDILINNAGIARLGSLLEISDQDWRDSFAANVDGLFHVTRAVVPGMVARQRGRWSIWRPGSGAAATATLPPAPPQIRGHRFDAMLGGGGGGQRRARQCRVSSSLPIPRCVPPSMRQARRLALAAAEERVKAIPLRRAGSPEEVAQVVVLLASDAAAYVAGAAYDVCGGHWLS